MFEWANDAMFLEWMLAYMQVYDGVLDGRMIPMELWRETFTQDYRGATASWSAIKHRYRPEFVQFVEEQVINPK